MNTVKYDNIHELLDRFFDGNTTCAEEKALEEYFTSGAPVPPDCEQYRAMFGWYASGMDKSLLPDKSKPKRRKMKAMAWIASSAAAAALIIGIGWAYRTGIAADSEPIAESYIVRDGRTITGDDEIGGDLAAALLDGLHLDDEIDRKIAMIEKEKNDILK